MRELEIQFDELPLIVENGFAAGLVDGFATITYHTDGEWSVCNIALDGAKFNPRSNDFRRPLFERKPVWLCKDSHPWLYSTIIDRLENSPYCESIADSISDALAMERDDARAQLGKDRAKGLEL